MFITDRDKVLLNTVSNFQCMTTLQISRYFGMNIKVCQRRLRILCKVGYLQKILIPSIKSGRSPYLYYLGHNGASLLNVTASKPRLTLQLSHQQKNTDVLINIFLRYKESPTIKMNYLTEHIIRSSNPENIIIPDGAFTLKREDKSALFLLENCVGTEIINSPTYNQDIESKFIRYTEKFTNNDIQFYSNYLSETFKRFRVLYITNTERRLDSISKIASKHDQHGFIWLSTLSKLKKQGIDSNIWYVPANGNLNVSIV